MSQEDASQIDFGRAWFAKRGWSPFPFQLSTWQAHLKGKSGLVNAPTGSGKTYSLLVPILLEGLENKVTEGLQALWVTPVRALAKEIHASAEVGIQAFDLPWKVAIRTGDTSPTERAKQKKKPPQILITTPESIQLILASKDGVRFFSTLKTVVIDEWHELIGSKRGVQMELALSRFKGLCTELKIWGISATIGNMEESLHVLFGDWYANKRNQIVVVVADLRKEIEMETIYPDEVETFPWSGHIGTRLLPKILPIIYASKTTLIFTNTRGQCEIWYQRLLQADPELAGIIAMHHGSLSREIRDWVENALHSEQIKAVVCTSSLDLGVDFRPVETVIQIGSPKGVARFLQRAGRSGHQPGKTSKIYFLPTHSLEILEGGALKQAMLQNKVESRLPYIRSFDVLIQYIVSLAVADGFHPETIWPQVKGTFAYESLEESDWEQVIEFCVHGGKFEAYDQFKKLGKDANGVYRVLNKSIATRHRLSIGTIVGASDMEVRFQNGKKLGSIEEYFITKLNPGDNFWYAGRALKLVRIKNDVAIVQKTNAKTGKTPSWAGGRMPLSSELSEMIRREIDNFLSANIEYSDELQFLKPLFELQQELSLLPDSNTFLIEYFQDREGYHLLFFPFEGRYVHEGMGALMAYRISQIKPMSFSIAMTDYGFELLSNKPIPIEEALEGDLFSTRRLEDDIYNSVNAVEMARKRFWHIATIAGLLFKGYPGRNARDKHLQSNSSLIFDVLQDYDPNHLLYLQAYDEALTFQLEEQRLRRVLSDIKRQNIYLSMPERATPFAFPIMVDQLRERMSTEQLIDRIALMSMQTK